MQLFVYQMREVDADPTTRPKVEKPERRVTASLQTDAKPQRRRANTRDGKPDAHPTNFPLRPRLTQKPKHAAVDGNNEL